MRINNLQSRLNKLKKVKQKKHYFLRLQHIKPEYKQDKKLINSIQLEIMGINNAIRQVKRELEKA